MGEFQDNGFNWRILKTVQQFEEWLELTFEGSVPRSEPTDWVWPELLAEILLRLFQGVAVILLIWILWQLALILVPQLRQLQWRSQAVIETSSIPFRSVGEWFDQAQSARDRGDPAAACRYLYLALLRHLHDQEILPDLPSRTDGEYVRHLVSLHAQPLPAYELVIKTHESLCFDRATSISSSTMDRCFQALTEITQLAQPSPHHETTH